MHPTARHSAADCREIQKLAKRVSGRREQSSKDGSPPPRQRPGKEKASDSRAAAGEKELGYQSPARELKGVYHDDNSDSDNDDHRKKLGACLPSGHEDPSPRGPFDEAGGPKGGAAPQEEEHHHLLFAI